MPIVSSARAAELIFKSWEKAYSDIPDGVVVEGPRAGGHLGFKPEQIDDPDYAAGASSCPEVVEAARGVRGALEPRRCPSSPRAGSSRARTSYRFLKLGAKGVQMATRFVATDECDADRPLQEGLRRLQGRGYPHHPESRSACRAGRSGASSSKPSPAATRKSSAVPRAVLESCGAREARYCISEALDAARKGDLENGFVFCGANAHRVEAIVSVSISSSPGSGRDSPWPALPARCEARRSPGAGKASRRSGANTRRPWPACGAVPGRPAPAGRGQRSPVPGREGPDPRNG
ncbi:MAG: nitronate monooxygenase [Comamonadaceae bacterium]|nr:nitronate monooxygenase [Comamonadaceae bacterium]